MANPRPQPLTFSSIKPDASPPPSPDTDAEHSPVAGDLSPVPLAETHPIPTPRPIPPAPVSPPAAPGFAVEPGRLLSSMAEPRASARGAYILAGVASVLWIGALGAFALGYEGRGGPALTPLSAVFLALLVLAPMGLIWAGAYVVAQARILAAEARRAKRLTDELIGPTALAAAQTGAVVEAMRGQIATASEVANQARDHLTALRQALAIETERLAQATAQASRTAVGLVETLSRERGELNTLALTLDARSAAVTDAINRQAHMVAEASDLAETQLREAEAALAARAADFAAAAGEAVDISRVATEDLGRQIARLETASGGVGDQMRALEDGLTQQRAALVTVAHALRAEQEEFATVAESRTAQLAEFVASARRDVTQLNESATLGAQSLSGLIAEAREKFRELAQAAGAERDVFARSAEGTLKGLSEAGAREREHLESAMRSTIEALSTAAAEARDAADVHAEAARARVDLLNEAAFAAGQRADQVFEARLSEARGLIEQSARLVEDAGDQTARRLEAQVASARSALDGLNALMDQVAARAARLPEEAGAKAVEVKAAVEQGLSDLLASARRAAEETQAIDAAFQERVRRNYEMLSEAVQLMGVVAQGGQGAAVLQRTSVAERARSRVAAAQPAAPSPAAAAPVREAAAPSRAAGLATTTPEPAAPEAPPPAQPTPAPSAAADAAPLRGRLKLTPTATDDEFKAAFEAASGQAAPADETGWTWKELLTTLDGEPVEKASAPALAPAAGEPPDDRILGEEMFGHIEGMGIDPSALLPKGRIDEITAAILAGDGSGVREVVRTLAPAAIRRLARRQLSDTSFRARALVLVTRYGEAVGEAARRDRQGVQAAALLACKAGRAYLLLDAAGQPS